MPAQENLIVWMQSHRMSREDLAVALGYSSNFIVRITTGSRKITDGFRWRFGKVYGFDVAQKLLDREVE